MPRIINPDKTRSYVTIMPDPANEALVDINKTVIEELYKRHGAVLFRGYTFDLDIFKALVQVYCSHSVFNESDDRELVDKENIIQTVNFGQEAFPLHPELSRVPWKPDVCWFACVVPPESGGETTICDGIRIVKKMSSKNFKALKDRRLRYTNTCTPKEISFWLNSDRPTNMDLRNPPDDCPFEFNSVRGKICTNYIVPALHRPMFSKSLAFGNFLLFARYLHNLNSYPVFEDGSVVPDKLVESVKKIGDKIMVPIAWQANDILMLDNTRFLHGRNRIENKDQRYIITYFGFLKFAELDSEEARHARWRKTGALQDLFGY